MPRMFLGADFRGLLARHVGARSPRVQLAHVTPGTRTPGQETSGTNPARASYSARGYVEDYDASIPGTLVREGDRLVVLFAASIQGGYVPKPDDVVAIGGDEYRAVTVDSDGAEAVFLVQARGR